MARDLRPLDRDYDPALTWAGALALRLDTMTRAEIQAAWTSEEAKAHRDMLKKRAPDAIRQLINHVQDRISQLTKEKP